MSQNSDTGTETANKPVNSHRLESITPDSSTPQSGSPNSEAGYSPHSQPFAQRPTSLTSAGAAVRQSASTLPSPPPFTPGPETQSGEVSPVAFGTFSAGSCDSRGISSDTPGVTSVWAGSSTKAAAHQTESFAFHPPGASAASSPDVEQFQGASPNATLQPLSDLLGQAVQNLAASADTDATSECSETASRSSVNSRGSRRIDGQSPGDLLRKAKVIFEKRAAIEGSSRLRHSRKAALKTPLDKGIPVAPQNTPMDIEAEQRGDQISAFKSAVPSAADVPASHTPGSITGPSKPPLAGSPDSPHDRIMVPSAKVLSPPDSGVSVVSIGSVCPTAGEVGRKLDFSGVATEVTAMPVIADSVDDVYDEIGSPLSRSPVPLHKLLDSVQDTATKRDIREVLEGMPEQPDFEFDVHRASSEDPDLSSAFRGPAHAVSTIPARTWLTKTGTAMLWVLAFLGVCAAGMLAVELLPAGISDPGVLCTPYNREACLNAHKAYWAAADREPPAWRVMVKRVKWYLQDTWDVINSQIPSGVTEADMAEVLVSRISEDQQRDMSIELAQHLFGDMAADLVPPTIAARLAAAPAAIAAVHRKPSDLIAVSGGRPVLGDQQQFAPEPKLKETEPTFQEEPPAAHTAEDPLADTAEHQAPAATAELETVHENSEASEASVEAAADAAATQHQQHEVAVRTADLDAPPAGDTAAEVATLQAVVPAADISLPVAAEIMVESAALDAVLPDLEASAGDVPVDEQSMVAIDTMQQLDHQPAEQRAEQSPVEPVQQQQQQEAPESLNLMQTQWPLHQEAAAETVDKKAPTASGQQLEAVAGVTPTVQEPESAAAPDAARAMRQLDTDSTWNVADTSASAYLSYMVAGIAAVALAAAYFALPYLSNANRPQFVAAMADDAADEGEGPAEFASAAAQQAAEAAELDAARAPAEDAGALLSDEEMEPRVRGTPRRQSAAAVLDAAIIAGASTVEKVHKVLRFKTPPSPLDYFQRAAEAGAAAAPEQTTPRAASRGGAAGRSTRAASSRRTSSAAVEAHDDGEEVQQPAPPSTGKGRRTVRGRKSTVLPEVPEDQPAGDGALLSEEEHEQTATAAVRGGRRRLSAPAAELQADSGTASGRSRRRSAAAAAVSAQAETTPGRQPRRGSRYSQG